MGGMQVKGILKQDPKALDILHQERRGQVKTIVMKHFNGIIFHKSGPVNKQHTNQLVSRDESGE